MPGKWEPDDNVFTDYNGTVIDAYFDRNQFARVELVLLNETDNPKVPEWTERYGVGDPEKWELGEAGTSVISLDDKEQFNGKSGIGLFQKALIKCVGSVDELESWGDPFQSATYLGRQFHYSDTATTYDMTATGGKKGTSHRNYPDTYLGTIAIDNVDRMAKRLGGSAEDEVAEVIPEGLMLQVTALANQHSYSQWVDEVMDLKGAMECGMLRKALETRELYDSLREI